MLLFLQEGRDKKMSRKRPKGTFCNISGWSSVRTRRLTMIGKIPCSYLLENSMWECCAFEVNGTCYYAFRLRGTPVELCDRDLVEKVFRNEDLLKLIGSYISFDSDTAFMFVLQVNRTFLRVFSGNYLVRMYMHTLFVEQNGPCEVALADQRNDIGELLSRLGQKFEKSDLS